MIDKEYWNNRYEDGETGWDIGYPSIPIAEYCKQLTDKSIKILIPGAGNSYEAEYLFNLGFENVFVLDISENAIESFKNRVGGFPKDQIIHCDFFQYEGQFDLIIEQTFYCAIQPDLREAYANKIYDLLKPSGKVMGLLFKFPLTEKGPPFGGSKEEYQKRLSNKLQLLKLEDAYNSIEPRHGNEYFFIAQKKMN